MVFIFFYWAPIVKNTCTIEQQSHNKIIQYSRTMSGLVIFAILTYLLKSLSHYYIKFDNGHNIFPKTFVTYVSDIKGLIQEILKVVLLDEQFMLNIATKVAKKLDIDKKFGTVETQIKTVNSEIKLLKQRIVYMEQYSRHNNLRIYGVPENPQANIIDALNASTSHNFSITKVEACYRMGNKDINSTPRYLP
ncbi:hypothetical protein NQ315_011193 [Exocentrus adspersus]|uniref:Uncharacterized protein n=1 Tax=Exocentrus adspersus TaxID=1586481 RepID=A0AAV8V6K1_9CUCU|nr:hypothetical protein NQ315_011193 [Exocentrus adspersus]